VEDGGITGAALYYYYQWQPTRGGVLPGRPPPWTPRPPWLLQEPDAFKNGIKRDKPRLESS